MQSSPLTPQAVGALVQQSPGSVQSDDAVRNWMAHQRWQMGMGGEGYGQGGGEDGMGGVYEQRGFGSPVDGGRGYHGV